MRVYNCFTFLQTELTKQSKVEMLREPGIELKAPLIWGRIVLYFDRKRSGTMAVEEPGLAVVSRQILVSNNTRADRCFKWANANKACNLTDFASFALVLNLY